MDKRETKRLRAIRPHLDESILIDLRRDYECFRKKYFKNSIFPVDAIAFCRVNIPIMHDE